jgi:hypothetical protein
VCYGGSDPSVESASNISKEQQAMMNQIFDWISPVLNQRAAGQQFQGQLVADTPAQFGQAATEFEGFSSEVSDAISTQLSGEGAYTFDAAQAAKRWEESFAAPVMETFRNTVLPGLKEELNAPGGLYSRGANQFLGKQTTDFFGQNVVPTFYQDYQQGLGREFQSGENARAAQFQATQLPFQQFSGRAAVSDALQGKSQANLEAELFRWQQGDPFKYAQLGAGLSGTQTVENIGFQGQDSPWAGVAGAALGGAAGGAFGLGGAFGQAI